MMQDTTVIYEDASVAVINKPAGLIVHSDGRTKEPTLAAWILARYPETSGVGEPWVSPQGETIPRPGIVHRLDRTTSGVMVIAKTGEAHAFLKAQFQNREVEKEYRAFVYGHPKEDSGTIEAEIVRIRSTQPRWGTRRTGEEKKHRAAITEWRVFQRATIQNVAVGQLHFEPVSHMALFPKTGRTHQLRVHLKHAGYPIVCDGVYAAGRPCLLGFSRPALHAFRLTFKLPSEEPNVAFGQLHSGETRTFEAPPPEDFQHAEKTLKNID